MSAIRPLLGIPPSEALVGIARRMRVPFDPQSIHERFEAHPSPRSLLALVEIARTVGIEARAFEADASDLATATLPAVVHLLDTGGGDSAFALLLASGEDGSLLENPTTRRTVRLDPGTFREAWTGVVVFFERSAAAVPDPESVGRGWAAAAVGDAALAPARAVGAALTLVLAVVAGVRLGAVGGPLAALLAAAGTAAGAILLASSRRSRVASAASRLAGVLCRRGTLVDCEGVLGSRYARLGPIELSAWGFAFTASTLVVFALGSFLPGESLRGLAAWLALAALGAAPLSLFLIGVQVWPLRRFCPLCMIVHAAVLGSGGLGLFHLASFPSVGAVAAAGAPWALLHGFVFLGALGLAVPFVEMGVENRTHRARLAWIAGTPWGAFAEFAGRPGTGFSLPRIVGSLGASGRFHIDVLVHPTCAGCPPVLEDLESLVRRRPGAVTVHLHVPPRDPGVPEDRELCAALEAVGAIAGGDRLLRVLAAVKHDPWTRLEAARGGAERVVREFIPPEVPLGEMLDRAREAVDAAAGVLDALRRGTPTLLVEGRPWDAPIEALEALVASHPDLLEDAVRTGGTERPA